MRYSDEQRKRISDESKGKTIETMGWEPDDGGYWVITFTDGSELSVRLMAELVDRD